MQLDKNMILDLLRDRGQQDQADQAAQQLVQKFMNGGGLPKL